MAAGSLTIIPRYVGLLAAGTADSTATPTVNGTTIFAGLEVEGRTLTVETEESIIEDGQTTQIKYMVNWEFFIQGVDAQTGTNVNFPSKATYVLGKIALWGAVGTLGLGLDDVYIWASPDYSGGKIRTKINVKKEFIQYPNETNSPLTTFTTGA